MSKFHGVESVKTDNAKVSAKHLLRNSVLAQFDETSCLDVFCGAGKMWKSVWHKCDNYTGIDIRAFFDSRHTICGDALAVINNIDISGYNIFDIDAYGSPYDVLDLILSKTIDSQKIAFCITDGSAMDMRMGRVSKGMRLVSGISRHKIKKIHLIQDEVIEKIIKTTAAKLCGKVVDFHIATGVTGSAMRYYTFIVERNSERLSIDCDNRPVDISANLS